MKVAAFGRTSWLYESVKAVAARGHVVTLLGTARAADEYGVGHAEFESLAGDLGCDHFYASNLGRADIRSKLVDSQADVAISVNWPTVIDESVLALFPHGVLNAHAGDLPRYRGNAAPNWCILQGEAECVVSVHQMSPQLDAGPVFLKRRMPVTDRTYVRDIYRFLDEQIPQMFADTIDGLESGRCKPQTQPDDPRLSLRCLPRKEQDGLIEWGHSAEAIRRLVQCSSEPFHGAFTQLDTQKLIIWRARDEPLPSPHVGIPGQIVEIRRDCGDVSVYTGSGLLVLEEVETELEGRCQPSDVIKSTRIRLGMNLAMQVSELTGRLADLEKQMAIVTGTQEQPSLC